MAGQKGFVVVAARHQPAKQKPRRERERQDIPSHRPHHNPLLAFHKSAFVGGPRLNELRKLRPKHAIEEPFVV